MEGYGELKMNDIVLKYFKEYLGTKDMAEMTEVSPNMAGGGIFLYLCPGKCLVIHIVNRVKHVL